MALNKRELRSRGFHSKRRMYLEARGLSAMEKDKRKRNQRIRQRASYFIDNKGSIFGIIIMIFLIMALFSILSGNEVVDLGGFLAILREAPTVDLDWLNTSSLSLGDWGAFNFLRDLIGMLLGTLDVVSFIGTALVQVVLYIVYFLKVLLL